ncbi:MAG: acyl carrier protein [Roseovarius sp.]|nr:acyl carrier protein [Roseovarius sp.]|tara:strand:- start:53 stop:322 length:270 start_codon:yes stop_codon:yes gene_type:complete
MSVSKIAKLVSSMLTARGHSQELSKDDAIFTSGLLDSLAATELMMALENDFGINLADADFDISKLDTIGDLEALVSAQLAAVKSHSRRF